MKFTLEVDLDVLTGEQVEEVARILRYWAGNLKHYAVEEGAGEEVYDSGYAAVGRWAISA